MILIGWPGMAPLSDAQMILALVVIGAIVTAIVFEIAKRHARRDRTPDDDERN